MERSSLLPSERGIELDYDKQPEEVLNQWLHVLTQRDRTLKKNFYRGGIAVPQPFLFPVFRVVEKELISYGGEHLLDTFRSSPFGSSFTGGVGRNSSGQYHKVSAPSLVRGWYHNQEYWNRHMQDDWEGQIYRLDKLNPNESHISVAAHLFAHPEDLFPFELHQEYASARHHRQEFIVQLVNITGLTPNDFGYGMQVCDYSYQFLTEVQLSTTRTITTTLDTALAVLYGTVRISEAWGWAAFSNKMGWDSQETRAVLERALSNDVSLRDYVEYAQAGVHPELIEEAISSGIAADLAVHI